MSFSRPVTLLLWDHYRGYPNNAEGSGLDAVFQSELGQPTNGHIWQWTNKIWNKFNVISILGQISHMMIQYGDVYGAPINLLEHPKTMELRDDCVLLRLPTLKIIHFQVGVQGIVMVFSCWCVYTETVKYNNTLTAAYPSTTLVHRYCIHDRSILSTVSVCIPVPHRRHCSWFQQLQTCVADKLLMSNKTNIMAFCDMSKDEGRTWTTKL